MTNYITSQEWHAMSEDEKHAIEKTALFRHLHASGKLAAKALRKQIVGGKLDGDVYWNGEGPYGKGCGCIIGTIHAYKNKGFDEYAPALLYGIEAEYRYEDIPIYQPDKVDAIEKLAFNISEGDTPESNHTARLIVSWIDEFLALPPVRKKKVKT